MSCSKSAQTEIISGDLNILKVKLYKNDPARHYCPPHDHPYTHTMFGMVGVVKVKVVDDPSCGCGHVHELSAPDLLLVEADKLHDITPITDYAEVWCVRAYRDGEARL